jgi:uracil-DNA glycosylase
VIFDRDCRACPRLAGFLDSVRERNPDYYCLPVPPFGDTGGRFLIVGLAPGMHGANRTGRPFTGDHAGILLYRMLGAEINTCNPFLARELAALPEGSIVMALGGIAHRAIVKAVGARQADYKFGHGSLHDLGDFTVLDSYHCSRYNTNTGRLTESMFDAIFAEARELLDK